MTLREWWSLYDNQVAENKATEDAISGKPKFSKKELEMMGEMFRGEDDKATQGDNNS